MVRAKRVSSPYPKARLGTLPQATPRKELATRRALASGDNIPEKVDTRLPESQMRVRVVLERLDTRPHDGQVRGPAVLETLDTRRRDRQVRVLAARGKLEFQLHDG